LVKGLPIPFYKQLRMGLPAKRELTRLWSRQRPDIVHIATEGPLGWSALQVAKKLKLPVSTDFRTNFHAYSQHYGIGWLSGAIMAYLKKFHNAAQATMVPTSQLQGELDKVGFKHLSVVPRGVDTDVFSPDHRNEALRSSWGADSTTRVLLYVGRLAPEKNLKLVIQTYNNLKRNHADIKLVLVGDGPMRAGLEKDNPEVIFAGFQTGASLAQHYASGDIFLFASQTETFGNVTLEAMASRLAIVAFHHAAAGELIQSGVNGMLARTHSALDFGIAPSAGLCVLAAPTMVARANAVCGFRQLRHKLLTMLIPYIKVRQQKDAIMSTATLTSKGQITIPVEVRNDLQVDAGDRVEFVHIAPGRYEFVAATSEVTALKGMFGPPQKTVSIEAMNAAIAQRGAAAR
jgi:AbrB family looped-hinge helix DNA binding protein